MKELYDSGAQLRTLKPSRGGGGFACMHAKAWIVDKEVLLTGSCNLTHNGIENNVEHLVSIRTPAVVSSALADFELYWDQAKAVEEKEISRMLANDEKRKADKASKAEESSRVRSASGPSRSVSRSLSVELEEAHGNREG